MPLKKEEAAKYLGLSVRALEYHVSQGNVESRTKRGSHGDYRVFEKDDLDKLKKRLDARRAPTVPVVREESTASSAGDLDTLATLPETHSLMRVLLTLAQSQNERLQLPAPPAPDARPVVPPQDKLLLSLAEASALTGISTGKLRAFCVAGTLTAVKGKVARGWRVKRADLDSFIEKL